jgi:hypothetical protein
MNLHDENPKEKLSHPSVGMHGGDQSIQEISRKEKLSIGKSGFERSRVSMTNTLRHQKP